MIINWRGLLKFLLPFDVQNPLTKSHKEEFIKILFFISIIALMSAFVWNFHMICMSEKFKI